MLWRGYNVLCPMNKVARLKEEVKRIVWELRQMDVPEWEISELIKPAEPPLKKLVVKPDYRLFIGDSEIKLEPLHRAVYILYLLHPEGIRFKDLPDYRVELYGIYCGMKVNTLVPKKVKQSIIDVTDPTNHSINEKCARIKTAIRDVVGHKTADVYAISGKRGERKKIRLDMSLVVWEEKESPP
jgi:hypothetical protein